MSILTATDTRIPKSSHCHLHLSHATYMYAFMYVCMYVCMYIYISPSLSLSLYIYIYIALPPMSRPSASADVTWMEPILKPAAKGTWPYYYYD